MSEFMYVLKVIPPKKEDGSFMLQVQNGPMREDRNRQVEFVNILLIRVPKHMNLDGIEAGKYANIVYRNQGVATRKPNKPTYFTPELVAQSIKPAQGWQLGNEEDLYTIEN